MFVKDQGNNIYKITMIAGSLPSGFEEISVPEELQSEGVQWLEAVLIPEVPAVEGSPEYWSKEGEEHVLAQPMNPEFWSKDGEADVFEDPMDETWTYNAAAVDETWTYNVAIEAVEAIPAYWTVQKKVNADADKAKQQVNSIVKSAIEFGNSLIVSFATENVLLGITADGMTKAVRQKMAEIISALSTGSLYDAIDEIDNFPAENKDAKYITDARLQEYRDKITNYLGI